MKQTGQQKQNRKYYSKIIQTLLLISIAINDINIINSIRDSVF